MVHGRFLKLPHMVQGQSSMQLQKIIINKNAHKEIYGTINRTKWQQRDPCLGGVLSICEYARGVHVCMVGMWKRVFPWRELNGVGGGFG